MKLIKLVHELTHEAAHDTHKNIVYIHLIMCS